LPFVKRKRKVKEKKKKKKENGMKKCNEKN